MGNQKKKRTESRIFSDHKKIGKTFVPPMRQYFGGLGMISWVDQILPELIWLAVIIENLGVKRGVEIGTQIARLANTILSEETYRVCRDGTRPTDYSGGRRIKIYEVCRRLSPYGAPSSL